VRTFPQADGCRLFERLRPLGCATSLRLSPAAAARGCCCCCCRGHCIMMSVPLAPTGTHWHPLVVEPEPLPLAVVLVPRRFGGMIMIRLG
jgi:hypothetical protein